MPCGCGLTNNRNGSGQNIGNIIRNQQLIIARKQQIEKIKMQRLKKLKQQIIAKLKARIQNRT
jgi:hypothetical protein